MRLLVSGKTTPSVRAELAVLLKTRNPVRLTERTIRFALDQPVPCSSKEAIAVRCAELRLDHCFDDESHKLDDIAVLALDMDSTLITIECIDELAELVGRSEEVSRITEATMRGEIKDFASSLSARVALLKDAPASILERVYDERVKLTAGAEALLDEARGLGIKTILVSGGFTYFTDRLQERLAIDYTCANVLEIENGRLTGRVSGTVVDGEQKARFVAQIAKQHGANRDQIVAIGDGANDIPVMRLARLSVAFRAKPVVKTVATWAIDYSGLDVLLDWMDATHVGQAVGH